MATEEVSRERSPRNGGVEIPNRRKYKCYAVGVAYSGKGYFGFQFQPGDVPTIEKELQSALIAAGFIDKVMVEHEPSRQFLYWSRAARTDRGVHACMNVFSCRMDSDKIAQKSDGSSELDQEAFLSCLNSVLPAEKIRVLFINRVTMRFDARLHCDRRRYEYFVPSTIGDKRLDMDSFKSQLTKYIGTHNFHNFTKGMRVDDKASFRHIPSITVSQYENDSADFYVIQIIGQSFLLNQIRKMVSLAIESALGLCPPDAIEQALTRTDTVHIHMVPGEGLLLEKLIFKAYDTHKCSDYKVTTPFSWLIGDDQDEGGDEMVLKNISEFRINLVKTEILPQITDLFSNWINEVVIPNDWEKRHEITQ
jgi:tRNA pseudouridine38-40 synthase